MATADVIPEPRRRGFAEGGGFAHALTLTDIFCSAWRISYTIRAYGVLYQWKGLSDSACCECSAYPMHKQAPTDATRCTIGMPLHLT